MSAFDSNDNDEIDGDDFFLLNGPLGGHSQNDNNNNSHIGCGVVVALVIVVFILVKCLF